MLGKVIVGAKMNIVFNCDENYTLYLAVTILSILEKNKKSNIIFYILHTNISEKSQKVLTDFVQEKGQKIVFCLLQEKDLHLIDCLGSSASDITPVANARLLLYRYLPVEEKRALYLDCDILVNQDLTELYETDLKGNALGVIFDPHIEWYYLSRNIDYKKSIGLKKGFLYFNSGVLLIDLEQWRQKNIADSVLSYKEKFPHIGYNDQDVLNFFFEGEVKYLDMRFNFQGKLARDFFRGKILKNLSYPCSVPIVIFHDTGAKKAWSAKTSHFTGICFEKYFQQLPNKPKAWRDKKQRVPLYMKIKRRWYAFVRKYLFGIY